MPTATFLHHIQLSSQNFALKLPPERISVRTHFLAIIMISTTVACSTGGDFASSGGGPNKTQSKPSKSTHGPITQPVNNTSQHSIKKSQPKKIETEQAKVDQENDEDLTVETEADSDQDAAVKQQVIADITASLEQLRWELPCNTPPLPRLCRGTSTVSDQQVLSGDSGTLFDIKLRFRGLVEPKTYRGGQHNGGFWQIGGTPTSNGWNVYKLEISNPHQVYYLNRHEKTNIETFRIDYEADVQAYGGATFSITADTRDGLQSGNYENIVFPEFSPTPFNGQFIQVTVSQIKAKDQ